MYYLTQELNAIQLYPNYLIQFLQNHDLVEGLKKLQWVSWRFDKQLSKTVYSGWAEGLISKIGTAEDFNTNYQWETGSNKWLQAS